jgi:glycosyltransferase involved in cell wall biosynthesis
VKPLIYFLVTNDLSNDQRMRRICLSLTGKYRPKLVGRKFSHSQILTLPFETIRLKCWINKGKLFYLEYQIRLFFMLLFKRFDAICAIDYDTLPAALLMTRIKGKKLIFDGHEYFTEVPELEDRPVSKSIWSFVGKVGIPYADLCYTVNKSLADRYTEIYKKQFFVVRNMPDTIVHPHRDDTFNSNTLWYQGVLNKGRGLEQLIESLLLLPDMKLEIAGQGDVGTKLSEIVEQLNLHDRVQFLGSLSREEMSYRARQSFLGFNLLVSNSLNYYYSLANKFFDYVNSGLPQVCMDFPEYKSLNDEHEVAILTDECTPEAIAALVQQCKKDHERYVELSRNCLTAAHKWNWQNESINLVGLYDELFSE